MALNTRIVLSAQDRASQAFKSLGKNSTSSQKKVFGVNSALKSTNKTLGVMSERIKLLTAGVGVGSLAGVAFGLSRIAKEAIAVKVDFDQINNTLTAVRGSSKSAAVEFSFLEKEADRLGLQLRPLAETYTRLAASTNLIGISTEDTREIFTSFAEALTTFGADRQKTIRVFAALEQIAAKGVVSMEELRQQLGEALPGSFVLGAKAVGKTSEEFAKLVAQGKITSKEFLLPFARAVREDLGKGAVQGAQLLGRQFDRLTNAAEKLFDTIGDNIEAGGIGGALKSLTGLLKDEGFVDSIGKLAKDLASLFSTAVKSLVELSRWLRAIMPDIKVLLPLLGVGAIVGTRALAKGAGNAISGVIGRGVRGGGLGGRTGPVPVIIVGSAPGMGGVPGFGGGKRKSSTKMPMPGRSGKLQAMKDSVMGSMVAGPSAVQKAKGGSKISSALGRIHPKLSGLLPWMGQFTGFLGKAVMGLGKLLGPIGLLTVSAGSLVKIFDELGERRKAAEAEKQFEANQSEALRFTKLVNIGRRDIARGDRLGAGKKVREDLIEKYLDFAVDAKDPELQKKAEKIVTKLYAAVSKADVTYTSEFERNRQKQREAGNKILGDFATQQREAQLPQLLKNYYGIKQLPAGLTGAFRDLSKKGFKARDIIGRKEIRDAVGRQKGKEQQERAKNFKEFQENTKRIKAENLVRATLKDRQADYVINYDRAKREAIKGGATEAQARVAARQRALALDKGPADPQLLRFDAIQATKAENVRSKFVSATRGVGKAKSAETQREKLLRIAEDQKKLAEESTAAMVGLRNTIEQISVEMVK